ncbi:MAG: hypothetical protein ACM65L_02420 [Microcoleus sp.]
MACQFLIQQLKRPTIATGLAIMQSYAIVCDSCVGLEELKYIGHNQ